MNRKRKYIYYLLVLALLFNYAIVMADGVGGLKNKQGSNKQQMEQKEKEIRKLESQSKDVSTQIQELDKGLNSAVAELGKVEKELDALNDDIDKTMKELEKAEEKIGEKQNVFNSRLRVMYKNGNIGYLEVLLASKSIGDFLARKEMLQSIANHDVDLLKHMKEQRDIIDNKNIELKAKRASKEAARSKLSNRREELARATRAKQSFIDDLNKDIKKAEQEYDELNRIAKAIAAEIASKQDTSKPYPGGGSGGSSGGTTGGSMAWPVPGHSRISSPYGWRLHPIINKNKFHTGIDIPATTGTNVIAAADGVVLSSGWRNGYGNTVVIDHGGGISTLYGHNSSLVVGSGTRVTKGTVIAKVGSTGNSTGPHCHFEVIKNGQHIDPMPWLRGR